MYVCILNTIKLANRLCKLIHKAKTCFNVFSKALFTIQTFSRFFMGIIFFLTDF